MVQHVHMVIMYQLGLQTTMEPVDRIDTSLQLASLVYYITRARESQEIEVDSMELHPNSVPGGWMLDSQSALAEKRHERSNRLVLKSREQTVRAQ